MSDYETYGKVMMPIVNREVEDSNRMSQFEGSKRSETHSEKGYSN
jgi:hypothetical protein